MSMGKNVYVSESTHTKLKLASASEGKTIKEFVDEIAEDIEINAEENL